MSSIAGKVGCWADDGDWFQQIRNRIKSLTHNEAEIVKYLKSSGSQRIETGVIPIGTINTTLDYDDQNGVIGGFFGVRVSLYDRPCVLTHNGVFGGFRWDYGNVLNVGKSISGRHVANTRGREFFLDGDLYATGVGFSGAWANLDVWLFDFNTNGYSSNPMSDLCVYAFELDDDSGLRFNGVPFLDIEGGGMFDIATDTIKRNCGSGSFVFGDVVYDVSQLTPAQISLWSSRSTRRGSGLLKGE